MRRARRCRPADPLRIRRGPSSARRRRRRVFGAPVRAGGARVAALAARRRGRPLARPRPAAPHRRSGRGRRGGRGGAGRGAGRVPHPAGRCLAPAPRRGAGRCPASRRFWRWPGVRCWRAPRSAMRRIGIEAEARPPIEGLTDAAARLAAGLDRLSAALRRLPLPAAPARRPAEPARRGACASASTRSCAGSNAAPTYSSAAGSRCCAISASRRGRRPSNGWRSSAPRGPRPISPSTATGSTPASRSRQSSRNRRTVCSSPRRR